MEGIGKNEGGNINRMSDILFGILAVLIGAILIGMEWSYCTVRDFYYWIRGLV